MTLVVSQSKCPTCGHPLEEIVGWEEPSGEPSDTDVTHDMTSDGKLWCRVCQGECRLLEDLRASLREADEFLVSWWNGADVGNPLLRLTYNHLERDGVDPQTGKLVRPSEQGP